MNLYDQLGVGKTSSEEVIKLAWKRLCGKLHPDREGGDAEALVRVNKAYEVLGDPERRKLYDETGSSAARDVANELRQTFATLLFGVMQQNGFDPRWSNIVSALNAEVKKIDAQAAQNKRGLELELAKLQQALKRSKGAILLTLLNGQIGLVERALLEMEERDARSVELKRMIAECEYTSDQQASTSNQGDGYGGQGLNQFRGTFGNQSGSGQW